MSIVVDSSVWIEATTRALGWHRFAPYLAKTGDLLISSVVIAEVRKWFLLKEDEYRAAVVLGYLLRHEVVTLDANLAVP